MMLPCFCCGSSLVMLGGAKLYRLGDKKAKNTDYTTLGPSHSFRCRSMALAYLCILSLFFCRGRLIVAGISAQENHCLVVVNGKSCLAAFTSVLAHVLCVNCSVDCSITKDI